MYSLFIITSLTLHSRFFIEIHFDGIAFNKFTVDTKITIANIFFHNFRDFMQYCFYSLTTCKMSYISKSENTSYSTLKS